MKQRWRSEKGYPPLGCRNVFLATNFLLFFLLVAVVAQVEEEELSKEIPPVGFREGSPLCPCLPALPLTVDDRDLANPNLENHLGKLFDSPTYGVGCGAHDVKTPLCLEESNYCDRAKHMVPSPFGCDMSWCSRSWCFVDPLNCTLASRRSSAFAHSNRHYSYATCGHMDIFTHVQRFKALEGQIFKVGFNSNSGGWLGAYNKDKQHYQGPIDNWSGPVVDFVIQAARIGRFQMEITPPPPTLWVHSVEYFESESNFDFCVYAASLGYLDMCVAQYTITERRAASTDWLTLGSVGIYLIVNRDADNGRDLNYFFRSIATIFSPFTPHTWLFICAFVIPILGILMVVHERGRGASSSYPTEEVVLMTNDKTGESMIKKIPIPIYMSIIKSIYVAFLAVMQQTYDPAVSTLGAMLNLLGIAFFILTIVAVYTANLAAILSHNVENVVVSNLDDAIAAGYRFCSERKNMESVLNVFPTLDRNRFVVDPPEIGGDGEPGFTCSACQSRARVFDFLDPLRANRDPKYCHAAIAPEEDLDVFASKALHCNKTIVGKPVQMVQTGMPVFENVSPQLISFFLKLQNDGVYDAGLLANKPNSRCTMPGGDDNAVGLTISQLSGIWVVSFGFAFLGLAATFWQTCLKCQNRGEKTVQMKRVYKRDQRGARIEVLGMQDTWMAGTWDRDGKPALMEDLSMAGSTHLMELRGSIPSAPFDRDPRLSELSELHSRISGQTRRRGGPARDDSAGESRFNASLTMIDEELEAASDRDFSR
ncbi:glutamate receptor [Seminavis robusta]|uniref:Glutamate receptor n=1 Tax=Seminavis robusta TaxID=568900 RepID=A0A9N8H0E3_9STRA|nr:glutamate receptor [Seminavis robusta]|eukprot:Sro19_g013580.1 glutamate receptor (765) ;mRNA; f:130592-133085